MKKSLLVIMISLLTVLSGCSSNVVALNLTQPETVDELDQKFIYTTGVVLKDNALVKYKTFNRGDEIEIVDEDNRFYYINDDNLILGVLKSYVRTELDDQFVEYSGYAKSGAGLYSDIDLSNKIKTLSLNSNIKVLDSFLGVLLVEVDGVVGYMSGNSVSKTKIVIAPSKPTAPANPAPSAPSAPYAPSNSSSSEPNRDGEDIPTPPQNPSGSSNGDGEDITLRAKIETSGMPVFCSTTMSVKAKVLVDNTPAYIAILNRGDEVSIYSIGDEYSEVLITGRIGTIETMFIRPETDLYLAFEGYARNNTSVYADYELTEKIKTCSLNYVVQVIDEVGDRFVVVLDDGQVGYVLKTQISDTKIKVAAQKPQPKPVESVPSADPEPSNPAPSNPEPPASSDDDLGEWTAPLL